ncbi:MAG TPA: hypothetical protein VJL29_11890 [Thermoguttaceae bacterium]|nr:hypothetical protein [Thermoguttaceae bacterium]
MYRKQILLVSLSLSAAWLACRVEAQAQTTSNTSKPSLVERIDNFGQNLMGGLFPRSSKSNPSTTALRQRALDNDPSPRAGSGIRPAPTVASPRQRQANSAASTTPVAKSDLFPVNLGSGSGDRQGQTASAADSSEYGSAGRPTVPVHEEYPSVAEITQGRSAAIPVASSAAPQIDTDIEPPPAQPTVGGLTTSVPVAGGGLLVRNTTIAEPPAAPSGASAAVQPSASSDSTAEPLHERLARFRKSVFGDATPAASSTTPAVVRPTMTAPSTDIAPPAAGPTAAAPMENKSQAPAPTLTPNEPVATPAAEAAAQPTETDGPSLTHRAPTMPATRQDDGVLLARRSPILNVETLGPARIAVGKQSTYEIHVENAGEVAAEDVVVTIGLPEWAEVRGREATSGAILAEESPDGSLRMLWRIGPMEAKARQKATLAIVPRESRPIDLAVRWDFTPIASQTVIEVEEPRLSLQLAGPREVRFDEPQVFKLEIANSGNGAADDMVLTLMPLSPGDGAPTQHRLGTLAAGQSKMIDMELTARQAGTLAVRMELRCDGPAKATLNEALLVRKANVEVAVEAPKMQYTGAVATYRVRVRNSGNTAAEKVRLVAKIPPEAQLIAVKGEGRPGPDGQSVEWTLGQLPEGAEQELLVQCRLGREGYSQFKAEATGDKVAAETTAVTRVESIADLALAVRDPSGPVPLGETAEYTLVIHNRGTKDAAGVEGIAYFSAGIEPISAEGSHYQIRPGQVVFDSIGVVPAGKKVVLKVTAQAQSPGNHMFRAEVYCQPLGTKLVGEETTHFYQGDADLPAERPMLSEASPSPPAATTNPTVPPPMGENPTRTADTRNQPVPRGAAATDVPFPTSDAPPARY